MLENQFIQFLAEERDDCVPVPIMKGDDIKYLTDSNFAGLDIIDSEGNEQFIPSILYESTRMGGGLNDVKISNAAFQHIGVGQCFRLRELSLTEVSVPLQDIHLERLCDGAGDGIIDGDETLTAGDYVIVFENGLNIGGQWNLEEPTQNVDGYIHVYLYGQTKGVDAGFLEFTNGQLINDSLSFSIQEDSVLWMDLSILRVDGIIPDCVNCQLWLKLETTPPSFYKKTYGKISNSLRVYENSDYFAKLKYYCDDEAFGFPFHLMSSSNFPEIALPIRMHSPQNNQEDKTYVKSDGSVVTLYAKYYKEWECETDYLPEDMHDKIVAALSCDVVLINNVRVIKSDKYEVDWEKYDLACDGVTKLARATFKVRANITQRNSNY